MEKQEILRKAIIKALDNGWKKEIRRQRFGTIKENESKEEKPISLVDFVVKDIDSHMDLLIGTFISNPLMLLDHDFAKALFTKSKVVYAYKVKCDCNYEHFSRVDRQKDVPEKYHCTDCGKSLNIITIYEDNYLWQVRLQEMVLEEEGGSCKINTCKNRTE